ncbi:MAG: hypothetical protein LQ345_006133 [Seirophora villosa]|nr:MAG: hypothetical protein LQ345_006133 [Seirophora villosa]
MSHSIPTLSVYAQQGAASQSLSRGPPSHIHAPSLYPNRLPRPHSVLRKRAQPPLGPRITMHALRVTAYIGARTVLEDFYFELMMAAAGHPEGTTTDFIGFTYGKVAGCFDSDLPIRWAVIYDFAAKMLAKVMAGEQNFYIANIVTDLPDALGQQVIRFVMGTPATQPDIANEAWAATVGQWFTQAGLI